MRDRTATNTKKADKGVEKTTNINPQNPLKVNNPAKDVLVISYIGMRTQEVAVKGQKQINVTLQEDSKILDEVVVIGLRNKQTEAI